MPHLTYNNNSKIFSLYTSPGSICVSCLTHANATQLNLTTAFEVRIQTETWLPVNVTHEREDPGGLAALNRALSQVRVLRFLGTLIICIVSAIVIPASAAAAATALAESIQTAHAADALLTDTTQEMIQQTCIDWEILARLPAVIWLGEQQDALVTGQQLACDPGFSKLCVTPLKWNSSQHSWEEVQHRLHGAFSSNLKGQIDQLQLELHQQLQDIKPLTEQGVF